MGAHPYWYFIPYADNINGALAKLRQREFEAGRYNPVMPYIKFPINLAVDHPGPRHQSVEQARDITGADGTRSILDIESVGNVMEIGIAAPLGDEALDCLYDTTHPTRAMIESNMNFFNRIDRGQAIYILVYKDGKPDELFFAGYSFD